MKVKVHGTGKEFIRFIFGDIAERIVEVRKVESKKIKVQRKKGEF